MSTMRDCGIVTALLADRMAEFVQMLLGEPSQRGREEWRYGRKGSLPIIVAGPKRGKWFDHEAGRGGDALALVQHLRGLSIAEALRWSLAWLGETPAHGHDPSPARHAAPPDEAREASDAARTAKALALWHDAEEAIAGTPADTHLRTRGIVPERLPPHTNHAGWPAALRWHQQSRALTVAANDATTGLVRAVQRIMLGPDGSPVRRANGAKIKLTDGSMAGRAVRFGWELDPQGRWGVAEGVVTALAAAQLFGFPVWASLGSANMPAVMPPAWATSATIVADHDDAGMKAVLASADKLRARLPVRIVRAMQPGADVADLVEVAR